MTSADLGPQSPGDPPFRARMRRHQSWYRASRLEAAYGRGPTAESTAYYGNMLSSDAAAAGANFLTPGIFELAVARIDAGHGVERYRCLHNMLSSQPLCFNLFGPLAADLGLATSLLRATLPAEIQEVTGIEFEVAPEPASEYLGDKTAFDVLIRYVRPDGAPGFIGVEVKLTEPFSQKAYDMLSYQRLTAMVGSPFDPLHRAELVDARWNQLWRNHLLVQAVKAHPSTPSGTVGWLAVVRHPLDQDAAEAVAGYQRLLVDPAASFIDWRLDELVASWADIVRDGPHREWLDQLTTRYLDFHASERASAVPTLPPEPGSPAEVVTIFDGLERWLCRIEPFEPAPDHAPASPLALLVLDRLTSELPDLLTKFGGARALRVAFSPELSSGLRQGTHRLMATSKGAMPTAVDSSGRIAGQARVVNPTGELGGAALAGTLAMGVGAAAAIAQQRWLEETLSGIAATAERIEARLRDDDWGTLAHAEAIAHECWVAAERGSVPPQLAYELAIARSRAHAILASRRRWLTRLIARMDTYRDEKRGDAAASTWVAAIVREFDDPGIGVMDELSLLVRALLAAGRADAATAAALVVDGYGADAVEVVSRSMASARDTYNELYRRFRPLARYEPDLGKVADFIGRVPVVARKGLAARADETHAQAKAFFSYLDRHVGAVVEDDIDDSPLVVALPAELG